MITKRTFTNVVVFLLLSSLLVFLGLTKFVFSGANGRHVNVVFSDAQGLAPRDDVTIRGVPSGSVKRKATSGSCRMRWRGAASSRCRPTAFPRRAASWRRFRAIRTAGWEVRMRPTSFS